MGPVHMMLRACALRHTLRRSITLNLFHPLEQFQTAGEASATPGSPRVEATTYGRWRAWRRRTGRTAGARAPGPQHWRAQAPRRRAPPATATWRPRLCAGAPPPLSSAARTGSPLAPPAAGVHKLSGPQVKGLDTLPARATAGWLPRPCAGAPTPWSQQPQGLLMSTTCRRRAEAFLLGCLTAHSDSLHVTRHPRIDDQTR